MTDVQPPFQGCERLQQIHVAVIGGGLAGLAAAWHLKNWNVRTTVLEAAQFVGGRVFTDEQLVPGKRLEMGAELIGLNHSTWWYLAQQLGLHLIELPDDEQYEREGLRVRRACGGHEFTPEEWPVVKQDIERVQRAIGAEAQWVNADYPWTAGNAEALDKTSVAQALDRLFAAYPPQNPWSRCVFEFELANNNCAPVANQSYLALLALVSGGRYPSSPDDPTGMLGYWRYTETHRCQEGNGQLAWRLAGQLPDVRRGAHVTNMTIEQDGVWLQWTNDQARFDYVILAAPPSSWPQVSCPTLGWQPGWFSHGPACKYFAVYDGMFWLDPEIRLAPAATWDGIGQVWHATDKQQRTDVPAEVLAVFAGGKYAVRDQAHYQARLADLYGTKYPQRNGRLVDWSLWPYVWTGYAAPAPGEVTTVGPFLMAPYAGRLFFAGEQTCLAFVGYMEGALRSGFRAADHLMRLACGDFVVPEPTAVSWDRTQGSA